MHSDWLSINVSLPGEKAYDRLLPLYDNKVVDLRNLKQHIPEEHKEFCSEMFQWPMTQTIAQDE
jgi:hypothetical protein